MTYLWLFTCKEKPRSRQPALQSRVARNATRDLLYETAGSTVRIVWLPSKLSSINTAGNVIFLTPGSNRPGGDDTGVEKRNSVLTWSIIGDQCCFHGDGLLLYPASHELTARWHVHMRKSRDRKLCDVIDPYIRPLHCALPSFRPWRAEEKHLKNEHQSTPVSTGATPLLPEQLLSISKLCYSRAGWNVPSQQEKNHYPGNLGGNRR